MSVSKRTRHIPKAPSNEMLKPLFDCKIITGPRYSQAARGIKNLWWVKVTVPTKTIDILNLSIQNMPGFSGHRNFHFKSLNISLFGKWLFD